MEYLFWSVAAVFFVVVLWKYINGNQLGKNQSRGDFDHQLKTLIVLAENGSTMEVRQCNGDVALTFYREQGGGKEATILLRIPTSGWTEDKTAEMLRTLQANGFEMVDLFGRSRDAFVVCIHVDNIWDERCGLEAARAAHMVLDALRVPPTAKFDFSFNGTYSSRIRGRDWTYGPY